MESSLTNGVCSQPMHVVAIPYPGRGHINPMLNLCRLLAARGLLVTVVVTEEWLGLLASSSSSFLMPANLRLRSIPDVIPSERNRGADLSKFIQAVLTRMGEQVDQLIERLDSPADAIIADSTLPWAAEISRKREIPISSHFPQSASVFLAMYRLGELDAIRHQSVPIDISGEENKCLDYLPSFSSQDLEIFLSNTSPQNSLRIFVEVCSWFTSAQSLLFTSFYECESHASDALKSKLKVPIYHLGTSIPHMTLEPTTDPEKDAHTTSSYYKWLHSKPRSSVLYVSLGSFLPVSGTQMDEIAKGLLASGVHFLWVARGEAQRMKELSGDMGLVVSWCDQLRVLCHSSVGGFLTHCGWNSTQEGLFAGVPMVTFPITWDQYPNSKLVVDDWKIGLTLKEEGQQNSLVGGETIAKVVRMLMDLDADESRELRRRAKDMKEKCRKAVGEGGSSSIDFDAYVHNVLQRSPKARKSHI